MTAVEILRLVATVNLRPFNQYDWMAFAGCESDEPMIANVGDMVVIVDGDMITVTDAEGEQYSARVETVEY